MNWSVGRKIAAGYAVAVLALLVIGVIAFYATRKLISANQWVASTHIVLEKVDDIVKVMNAAESAQRGFLITGDDTFLKESYNGAAGQADQDLADLMELTTDDPDQKPRLEELRKLVDERFGELKEPLEVRKDDTDASLHAARKVIIDNRAQKRSVAQILQKVAEIKTQELDLLKQRNQEAASVADLATYVIVIGIPLALLLMVGAGFGITRSIARPLRDITAAAERLAAGDLGVEVAVGERSDEIGVLARTFATMTQNLRQIIADLAEGANVLSSASAQIVASTTELAAGSVQTASAVTETTSTVEEVRQTSQISSEKAKYVSESAQRAADISESGKTTTDEAIEGMGRIRQQMSAIADSMVRLSEQTQAIGQIIATVDDLSQQSNLLAVNASIEAAKAGEQGKGFAVVAQEVRSLAAQSKAATTQVRTILSDIQKATAAAAMATEQGTKAVEAGVRQSGQAADSILKLAGRVNEAAEAAGQIAASSEQQLAGMKQVATAMESIKRASTQNVDSAKQLETAARNLERVGQRLTELLGRYKV